MSTQGHLATAPTTRRERHRQATYDEIVAVSRRLLGDSDAFSLRAVATEMGMTAPALYRYVGSYQELVLLVAQSIFTDLLVALAQARDRHPDDDPAAQILAASVAFRRWALRNPREFGLVFANPVTSTGTDSQPTTEARTEGAAGTAGAGPESGPGMFGAVFSDMFIRIWQRYRFSLPSDDELDADVVEMLRDPQRSVQLPCEFPGYPLGLTWVFTRCWGRLYGTVTLEVFQHMEATIIRSGALFRAMLADNAADLALQDEWPRLGPLIDAELSRVG